MCLADPSLRVLRTFPKRTMAFRIVKSEFDILMWFITRVSDKDSHDRPTKPMDVLTIACTEAMITVG